MELRQGPQLNKASSVTGAIPHTGIVVEGRWQGRVVFLLVAINWDQF